MDPALSASNDAQMVSDESKARFLNTGHTLDRQVRFCEAYEDVSSIVWSMFQCVFLPC